MLTRRMQEIFRRYDITVRDGPQTVHYEANQISTVVEPEDFAIYEAMLKSYHVHEMVVVAMQNIGCPDLPWMSADVAQQAASDYRYCADALAEREGRDAETGQPRSLNASLPMDPNEWADLLRRPSGATPGSCPA
jgi:hypothetical protein